MDEKIELLKVRNEHIRNQIKELDLENIEFGSHLKQKLFILNDSYIFLNHGAFGCGKKKKKKY